MCVGFSDTCYFNGTRRPFLSSFSFSLVKARLALFDHVEDTTPRKFGFIGMTFPMSSSFPASNKLAGIKSVLTFVSTI